MMRLCDWPSETKVIIKATCTRCRLRAFSFKKLPTCLYNLTKSNINPVYGQKLKTSCDQNFYSSYRFHFDCCENARKRPGVSMPYVPGTTNVFIILWKHHVYKFTRCFYENIMIRVILVCDSFFRKPICVVYHCYNQPLTKPFSFGGSAQDHVKNLTLITRLYKVLQGVKVLFL